MKRLTRVAGLTAVLALGTAAAAQAHPGFYSVNAKVAFTYEQQTLTVTGAGTFKPSAGAATIATGATAAQVETALWSDPAIAFDNVDVSGPAGGPYAIRWTNSKTGAAPAGNIAPIVPSSTDGVTFGVVTDQDGGTPVTPATDPTGATEATQTQHVIANDGYTYQFTETNKLGGTGFLNLKFLPGAYRATLPPAQWLTYPGLATGIQAHATCAGVAALDDPANVLAAQEGDPFFDYIPWQKTSNHVGGDDDPAKWIAVVRNATGVDLDALDTVADFTSACSGLGGTYVPADTRAATATANIADALAPLNTQVTDLTSANAGLTSRLATALADAAGLQLQAAALELRTHKVTAKLAGSLSLTKTTTVRLTGPAGARIRVRMLVTPAQAKKLRLKSRVLAQKTQTLGADGAGAVKLAIATKAKKAARKASKRSVTIDALALDGFASIRGT